FSSRAESRWHAAAGGHIVGMTGMPEAGVAPGVALCYTSLAVVTDLDAGAETRTGVTHAPGPQGVAARTGRREGGAARRGRAPALGRCRRPAKSRRPAPPVRAAVNPHAARLGGLVGHGARAPADGTRPTARRRWAALRRAVRLALARH